MKVSGMKLRMLEMVKVSKYGQMDLFMKDIGETTKLTVEED